MRRVSGAGTRCCGAGVNPEAGGGESLRGLVHLFVDLLHRQLDVKLDAVEDILEVGLLIHLKLEKRRQTRRVCDE